MKSLTVADFKANFSQVIEWVLKGEVIAVTYGKSKKIIGYFSNNPRSENDPKRQLGLLAGKVEYRIQEDWEMDESYFVG